MEDKKPNKLNIFFQTIFIGIISEQACENIIVGIKTRSISTVILSLVIGIIEFITINTIWEICKNGEKEKKI